MIETPSGGERIPRPNVAGPIFEDGELDLLLDGLERLEKDDLDQAEQLPKAEFLSAMLPKQACCDEHTQVLRQFREQLEGQSATFKRERRIRRERFTLLKAKIIRIQQAQVPHCADANPDDPKAPKEREFREAPSA